MSATLFFTPALNRAERSKPLAHGLTVSALSVLAMLAPLHLHAAGSSGHGQPDKPASQTAGLSLADRVGQAVMEVVADAAPDASPSTAGRLGTPTWQGNAEVQRLKQALQTLALEHPEVLSALATAASSGFEVDAARQARYPRFKVGSASGNYNGGGEGERTQSYQLITAEARMRLIDGGAMSATVRAAQAGSQAEHDAAQSTSQQVVLDALTAYLQLQRFEIQRELASHATQVVAELARAEQRRVELGAAGQNDLRMASARRASIAAREANFAAQRDEALAKFQSYFGFVPEPHRLPLLMPSPAWAVSSQEEAQQRAENSSTELAEARARVAQAEALVAQQEASLWPTVEAVVVKSKDPRGVSPSEPTRAALELNWNFGSGFDRQLRVKTALSEVNNQRAKMESARRQLFEMTHTAWGRAQSGQQREQQLREAVQESGDAFRGRRRLLEFGRETLPHVLDAQLDYYTLLQDYIDAVFDQRITHFRLARVTGELRVQADTQTPWIEQIFGPIPGPVLDNDGVLDLRCMSGSGHHCLSAQTVSPAQARSSSLGIWGSEHEASSATATGASRSTAHQPLVEASNASRPNLALRASTRLSLPVVPVP